MIEQLGFLKKTLADIGLSLPEEHLSSQLLYLSRVLAKNEVMNLTSITEPKEAVVKHLVDSLSALALPSLRSLLESSPQSLWADLGSGAGLPGFPLALACPGIHMDLIEATTKKAHFLELLAAEMGLKDRIGVLNQRLELAGAAKAVPRGTSLRGRLDAVTARGLSHLAAVIELGIPLLKVGGLLLAYKGPKAEVELQESTRALKDLKAELLSKWAFDLPEAGGQRLLLVFVKKSETPSGFPRENGLPQKEPLK